MRGQVMKVLYIYFKNLTNEEAFTVSGRSEEIEKVRDTLIDAMKADSIWTKDNFTIRASEIRSMEII